MKMMMFIFTCLCCLVISSCSIINPNEQAEYEARQLRHGIIPRMDVSKAKTGSNQNPDGTSVTRGKEIYQSHCLSCHGDKGLGDGPDAKAMKTPPANLRKTVAEVDNFDFYISISNWIGKMPGWKEPLTETQRRDVANYIKLFRDLY